MILETVSSGTHKIFVSNIQAMISTSTDDINSSSAPALSWRVGNMQEQWSGEIRYWRGGDYVLPQLHIEFVMSVPVEWRRSGGGCRQGRICTSAEVRAVEVEVWAMPLLGLKDLYSLLTKLPIGCDLCRQLILFHIYLPSLNKPFSIVS